MCGAASCLATGAPAATGKESAVKATSTAHPAAKAAARQKTIVSLAPADEYFGPFKLSIIGINNTMRDTGRRYDVNHDIGDQTFASTQLIERAIRDWEKKYPKDDQLPRAVYFLQRLYEKILTQGSRDRAGATAKWLYADFGRSPQAKQLKKVLLAEHLEPLPPPTPTPVPTTLYPSVFGQAYPSEFNKATTPRSAPSAAPLAAPPAAAPVAAPTSPEPSSAAPRPSDAAPLPSTAAPLPSTAATAPPSAAPAPTTTHS